MNHLRNCVKGIGLHLMIKNLNEKFYDTYEESLNDLVGRKCVIVKNNNIKKLFVFIHLNEDDVDIFKARPNSDRTIDFVMC